MITVKTLNDYLTKYLNFDPKIKFSSFDADNANGLQVRGKENIEKIGFGVSASLEFFNLCKKKKCDAIIVHHGIRLPESPHYDSVFQNRISFLVKNNISLFGYHFLLDAHPEVGNNSRILKLLGAKKT